jgi:hypothetical protein
LFTSLFGWRTFATLALQRTPQGYRKAAAMVNEIATTHLIASLE